MEKSNVTSFPKGKVAKKAIKVAADICVFTNDNVRIEKV